jgi:phospholipid/cholesterol/gamma-HCH transport system substrate-binding protein
MKANYFKFGVFLLVATILLVTAIVILGARMFASGGKYFETYFDTPVSGLSPGTPVELRGVKVGEVKSIGFASEVYDLPPDFAGPLREQRLVRVVFAVSRRFAGEMPVAEQQVETSREIREGLRLRLEPNLLTGKSLLQGIYVDPNQYPVPQLAWKPQFPFVPSMPSQLATLTDSFTRILAQAKELDVQGLVRHVDDLVLAVRRAVVDVNVAGLSGQAAGLLAEARSKVHALDTEKIGRQVEGLMANADGAITEVRTTNQSLQQLLARPDKDKELANIATLVDELNTTVRRVNLLVATQAPRIESTLENFRKISNDVRELSENLKRSPSDLLLSSPPRKSELQK